jgi:hypothetical protein
LYALLTLSQIVSNEPAAFEFFGVQKRHHRVHNSSDQHCVRRNEANMQAVNPTESNDFPLITAIQTVISGPTAWVACK